jgi:bifunctional DNA-binding transcriptional regulator/antitoxin component of YhaV-PrlF toxin-antitoxin module
MSVSEDRVQIGKRGTVTLPVQLRKRYGLDAGDLLTVLDLGGVFVLSPEVSVVSKIAREIEQLREEAGLSLEEFLQGLDEQRRRLYQERYGSSA